MPNPQGNPDFKSKYGEKTKVIRLPVSIADAIASLLSSGCASSDILEQLQPMTQEKLVSDLSETDSTLVHLPVELRLLRAIKDVAKQEDTHYLQWITNQCKQGLDLSPNLSPAPASASSASPALSSEQLTALIDQRFDNFVTHLLDSLQAQLAAFDSRLSQLEHQPLLPSIPPESTTTAIANSTPKQTTSKSSKPTNKPTKSAQPTSQQPTPEADRAPQKSNSTPTSPIQLPSSFPCDGLASLDLAKLLHRHQATINAHRRQGNGFLAGWEYKQLIGHAGWRYFPTTPQALNLWTDAIKSGLLNPANAAND